MFASLSVFSFSLILFCRVRENSYYIVKYNLHTERVEASISVSNYSPRKNYYQWGGYSGMDLAVDEQGLWVLCGGTGNNGKLYVKKFDVYANVVTQTWALSTGKQTFCYNKNPETNLCKLFKLSDYYE